jgi:transcriptional regulator
MTRRAPATPRLDLLPGTLDLLVLQALQWGPRHGHGIGQLLRAQSEEAFQIEHGSLYPALHRLERAGWLEAEWKISEANRRAKFYRLTPAGKAQLGREQSRWKTVARTVARLMRRPEEA